MKCTTRLRSLLAWSLCTGALLACQPAQETVLDLVAALPAAEVWSEVGVVDVGSGDGEEPLRWGWSRQLESPDGTTFRWGVGERSELDFLLGEVRDLELELRLFPADRDLESAQRVAVELNGSQVTELTLGKGLELYSVSLPAARLVAGRNRLLFRYLPPPAAPDTPQPGAVGWDLVRFEPLPPFPARRPRPHDEMLFLPYGTEIEVFARLAPETRLAVENVHHLVGESASASRSGDLEIAAATDRGQVLATVQPDGEPAATLGTFSGRTRLPIPGPAGEIVRLVLRAVPPRPDFAGGVLLERARLEAPAGAIVRAQAPAGERQASRLELGRPNVLLYVVDTLRADRLGCYGYARNVSPRLDAFAAESILFEDAIAQSSWTKSSMASIFTGLRPAAHGIHEYNYGLAPSFATLAELLRDAGYETAGFAANGMVKPGSGMTQGFDSFDFETASAAELTTDALDWLGARTSDEPFFLYVHTVDPHAPYDPPAPYRTELAAGVAEGVGVDARARALANHEAVPSAAEIADLEALYDGEIAANDAAFGDLLDGLRELGLYDRMLVVFVSDHGDAFYEHGTFGHGRDLYGSVLRIPLLLHLPGGARAGRDRTLAQHVDLLPTIAALLGLEPEGHVEGRNLLASRAPRASELEVEAISQMDFGGRAGVSLVAGDWKLIEPLSRAFSAERMLFDRRSDPGETRNVIAEHPFLGSYLAFLARLEALREPEAKPEVLDFTQQELDGLRGLGYIE